MGTSIDPSGQTRSLPLASPSAPTDSCGILLDLALEATAATGAAFLVPADDTLRVLITRGTNAPALEELINLDGTVAGEAWYRGRLVIGPEAPPRGRQAALWQEDRTIDVMAVPITVEGRSVAVCILYHRHLGHFRRGDATTLTRLASLAAELWGGTRPASVLDGAAVLELRAAGRVALLGANQLDMVDTTLEVARTAATLLDVSSVRISLLAGDELVCHAAIGRFGSDVGRRRPRDFGFEGVALESMEGVLATEWSADHGGGPSSWIRSLVSVPLRRLDQIVGVLTVAEPEPARFTDHHRETLLRFAVHATAAIVELKLHAASSQHSGAGRIATRVAAALAASEDTPALRRNVVREARRVLAADAARLSELVQRHVAVTAIDGDLPIILQPPQPGTMLLCGHTLEASTPSHRCALAGGEGFLVASQLGQVTEHMGCVQVVRRGTPFDEDEEALLCRLTEITELALLSRMANVRVSQYADRLRSVAEVSASLHQSLRPSDAMAQAGEMLRRALNVGTVRVGHIDEVWQELVFPIDRHGAEVRDGYRRPLVKGLLEEVWRTGRTFFFPQNAAADIERMGLALDTRPRCIAVAPLRTRGTITGVISIEDEGTDHAFEAEDVRILEIVAQQLGVTLENLESLEEERRQRITAEWLRQMARAATDSGARPAQVFELATDAAFQGIGGVAAMVGLIPGDGTRLLVASRGAIPDTWHDPRPVAGSIAGWVIDEHGAVFISANLSQDPRLAPGIREIAGQMACAAVPIWCENRIIAILTLVRPMGSSFAVGEVERLAQIADHAGAGYQTARAGEALRKSEERYRRLFRSASDAIFTIDRDGTITSFNEAAERLWNVKVTDVVGLSWEAVLPFDSPAMVGEQIAHAVAGESCAFEAWLRRPGGERTVVAMSISPLVEQGRTTAVLAIVRDVSEQRGVQAQLLQAEKMSAIGQLVGGMAHEINNPLASILMNMELLLTEAKDPSQLETLTAIKTETDRAAQIVRNLLTYVRGQGSSRAMVDLRESIRSAYALRRNQLLNQQIEVEVDLPTTPAMLSGNTVNLQQVLMNLLVNAEHAIRSHRGKGHVWIRLEVNGGTAIITVDDNGPGIPPELLSRIFDPFYTTKPEGEGTGLGLSVSAGIIADHHGKIAAVERPGGGARFILELPLSQSELPAPPEEPVRVVSPPPTPLSRGRLLLVDDEPDIRRSISKFLTRTGWQVDLADSGEEGLRLLGEGDYQVVLCDLRMPGMSGHEFYRRLQAASSPAISRLVFMTGDVLSPEASRFLQEAARPVLSKPFTLRDLTDTLAQVEPA
jgi:two-component system NtrC family sensor kinase